MIERLPCPIDEHSCSLRVCRKRPDRPPCVSRSEGIAAYFNRRFDVIFYGNEDEFSKQALVNAVARQTQSLAREFGINLSLLSRFLESKMRQE